MSQSQKIPVNLAGQPYDIFLGAHLYENFVQMAELKAGQRIFIISETEIFERFQTSLEKSFSAAKIQYNPILLPSLGEDLKSFEWLEKIAETILSYGPERSEVIVALGGGVIGDLAGLVAGLLLRGMRYIQVPTTLLAQVDSSVGGKTAINVTQGKNLVGLFHQPSAVIIDTQSLQSLPPRQILAGYAEIVKYGLLGDDKFFAWLEENGRDVVTLKPEALHYAIQTSCQMKAKIVAADERESGARMLLNLGHTFAHAIEAEKGYGHVLHGEAVAIGMVLAAQLSCELGLLDEKSVLRIEKHFASIGLMTRLNQVDCRSASSLVTHMQSDKKKKDGQVRFILMKKIGEAFVSENLSLEKVTAFLERVISL